MLWILNSEVPNYCNQIPSPGLKIFPNPVTALGYMFSMSDPNSNRGYTEELKKFLKSHNLEQKNHTFSPDGAVFEEKGPINIACQFPIFFQHAVL